MDIQHTLQLHRTGQLEPLTIIRAVIDEAWTLPWCLDCDSNLILRIIICHEINSVLILRAEKYCSLGYLE